MKRTQVLLGQHIGWTYRQVWKAKRTRTLQDSGALRALKLKGIAYEDAIEVIKRPKPDISELNIFFPKSISMDENHPEYQVQPCLKYSDHNVLIGGVDQAKVFTNSHEMDSDSLPVIKDFKDNEFDASHDKLVKNCITTSLLFDATQEKLPIRKDPDRPAFVFPRDYGITDKRKNYLLGKKLMNLCALLSPNLINQHKQFAGEASFQVAIQRDGRNILLSSVAENLLTSNIKISAKVNPEATKAYTIPNILPLSPFASLEAHNFYKLEDNFPIIENMGKYHLHTAFIHFDKSEVRNLYDTEVTETQIYARSLMKCFTFASAQAKYNFGKDIMDLPEPITVQCVQIDSGKKFHFSVLQLNTIGGPDETNIRNVYWSVPFMSLYETCDYVDGKPVLGGYNPQVFLTLLKFFQNS